MVKDSGGIWHVQPRPKTDASFRTVDFPEFVIEHIPKKEGRIFDCNPDNITNRFHRTIKRNNLSPFRFHDLRHSCASLLLASGVPMKHIQEWLGHSDFSTTANIYAHLDYSSKLTSASAMESNFHLGAWKRSHQLKLIAPVAEGVGFEPTGRLNTGQTISSRSRYDLFDSPPNMSIPILS